MGQNEILDNLSGQAIKEMISRKEITIEELDTRALDALFDYESEMVGAGESDDELLQLIAKLLDPEEQTDDVEQKYRDLIRRALGPRTIRDNSTRRKRLRLRKVLIIAATFLVLVVGISAIAEAMGVGIFAHIREIMGLPAGSRLEKETITLIRLNESKEYESVEELLREQDLDVLYPTVLPDGILMKSVYIFDVENGGESISFFTYSVDTSIIVDTCVDMKTEDYTDCEKYHVEGRDFYLFEESGHYALCYENNNLYTIRSTSRENIILIIKNMKEFGQ